MRYVKCKPRWRANWMDLVFSWISMDRHMLVTEQSWAMAFQVRRPHWIYLKMINTQGFTSTRAGRNQRVCREPALMLWPQEQRADLRYITSEDERLIVNNNPTWGTDLGRQGAWGLHGSSWSQSSAFQQTSGSSFWQEIFLHASSYRKTQKEEITMEEQNRTRLFVVTVPEMAQDRYITVWVFSPFQCRNEILYF